MTEQFQFDTAGEISYVIGGGSMMRFRVFDDLSPGVQGCIAEMLEEASRQGLTIEVQRPLAPEDEAYWHGDRELAFSDLHSDTLARIIADWERFCRISGCPAANVEQARHFWIRRQRGIVDSFPPVTPCLNDEGTVCLRDAGVGGA